MLQLGSTAARIQVHFAHLTCFFLKARGSPGSSAITLPESYSISAESCTCRISFFMSQHAEHTTMGRKTIPITLEFGLLRII